MELVIAIGALLAIYFVASFRSQGQDSVDDLGGYVDTSPTSAVESLAQAIATAEGFFVIGSRPNRNHNPGDMTRDLIGKAVGTDGAFVVYENDEDGWENLYAQVNAWFNGTSHFHSSSSTIADLAGLGSETGYTSTDQQAWANIVAQVLGVDINTQIGELA